MSVSRRVRLASVGVAAAATLLAAPVLLPMMGGTASAAVGGCTATATIQSQWGSGASGGEIVAVTVTNVSPQPSTTWSVTWTATGQVLSAWNATVTTSGGTATAVNASYNGRLAPAASTTFGMQLTGTAPAPVMSCASDAAPPTSISPSSSSSSGADVTVALGDSTQRVTLLVGQTLGVSLPSRFTPTTVTGPALSPVSTSGGYPTGQPLAALYRAAAPGTVDVTSVSDDPCLHTSPPCTIPVQLWVVHVQVLSSGGQTVTVTTADNNHAVSLHVGDTLAVNLPNMYVPPRVSPAGVLAARDVAGGYPTNQPLVAHYVATAPGQADVSSYTDYACNHDPTPCPAPIMTWVIHVTVTA
ncbi:cellulose binding domain-containing protein [Dactylosporangium sp. McL0621]|uniref:cellulose binding domain-containing protein n=1 Tax=Dactylosporangium sp. McL0621 TaxID=3415678 RepID=UPI003CEAC922